VKGTQHDDAFDSRQREFRGNVGSNTGQPKDLNIQTLVRGLERLQILPGKTLEPEHQRTTRNRFPHDPRMQRELVADCRPDQSVRFE